MFQKASMAIKLSQAVLVQSFLPKKLTIALTYLCQSRCNYCGIWKRYQENPDELVEEAQDHIYLGLLRSLRNSVLWIEFTGGEPFLRKNAGTIIRAAMNETGAFAVGVTSNGLDSELVLKQVSNILTTTKRKQLVVGISIDGEPALYERARGVDGFEKAVYTYLKLKQISKLHKNMRPHIAYTINQFNAGHFLDFYKFMSEEYDVRIDDISFSVQHNFGYYFPEKLSTSKCIDDFKREALVDISSILDIKRRSKMRFLNPINLFYEYYLVNVSKYFANPHKQIIPCKACDFSAFVDPYGQVYPCGLWDHPLGSLKNMDFEAIWRSSRRLIAAKLIAQNKCPNCWTPCEAQPSWIANICHLRSG